jgi:casein kinase II subunit beta
MKGLLGPRILVFGSHQISIAPPTSASGVAPWITQFCQEPANSWYVPIDVDWAADWFNQHGISNHFDNFDEAIELIADRQSSKWESFTDEQIRDIHTQALRIYGLLHARWICQPRGMSLMKEKYDAGIFGQCPRFSCNGTKMLPMGTTLIPRRHSVKLFCPTCCDIYRCPPDRSIDGAHFGPAFPHMFLFEYSECDKCREFKPFERMAFGFKVRSARQSRALPHATNVHDVEQLETWDAL